MRYVEARYSDWRFEALYRYYVADALYCLKSTDSSMKKRLYDIMYSSPQQEETRTEQEIIDDLCTRYGIKIVG